MTLGSRLIHELAKRRELGMYFDFAGYRALRRVVAPDELSEFLKDRGFVGFDNARKTEDVVQIAGWLRCGVQKPTGPDLLIWLAFDPIGGIVALLLWLMSRLTQRSS
jgi:hypothetical protein